MNEASSHRRVEEILIAALETPREKLDDYLREACGNDAELCGRVRKMVEREDALRQSTVTTNSGREPPVPPRQVGPYQLHSPIGSGSFGVVYLASRADELRRRVAIKFLKPWMDPAQFRAETQYLALLKAVIPTSSRVSRFRTREQRAIFTVRDGVRGGPGSHGVLPHARRSGAGRAAKSLPDYLFGRTGRPSCAAGASRPEAGQHPRDPGGRSESPRLGPQGAPAPARSGAARQSAERTGTDCRNVGVCQPGATAWRAGDHCHRYLLAGRHFV